MSSSGRGSLDVGVVRSPGRGWHPDSMSATCFLMVEAAVRRGSPADLTGARSAMNAKDRNRSQVSVLGSLIALSISFDKQSAAETRAAFGILLITPQLRLNSASRSERLTGVETEGARLDCETAVASPGAGEIVELPRHSLQCQMLSARAWARVSLAQDVCQRTPQLLQTIAAFLLDVLGQAAQAS